MAFKFSPRIVTDGLILYSDVSNSRSFVSGSTTLNDMSLTQINGVLSGGTTYTTNNINNIGSLTFNGTGSSVNYGSATTYNLNTGSVCVFTKIPNQIDVVNHKGIIVKQGRYGLFALNNVLVSFDWGSALTRTTTFTITDNAWHYLTMTWTDMTGTPSNNARIYVDGNLLLTTTIQFAYDTSPLLLGFGNSFGTNQFLTGDVNVAQVYNRVLTQQEIIQNYNTLKSRFGK